MLGASFVVAVGMDLSPSGSHAGSKTSTIEVPKSLGIGDDDFHRLRFLDEATRLFKEDTDELETLIISNSDTSMLRSTL